MRNGLLFTCFKYMIVSASVLGLIGGTIIGVGRLDASGAVLIIAGLFLMAVVAFAVLLVLLIRRNGEYWLDLWRSNRSECIGQALGISVFGSLFAIMFYMAGILLLPYLFASPISSELTDHIGVVFDFTNLLGMVVVTSLAAGLSLTSLRP